MISTTRTRTRVSGIEAAKKMLEEANLPINDENIFIASTCKEKGILYLTGKAKVNGVRLKSQEKKAEAPAAAKKASNGEYTVTVNGKAYGVKLDANAAVVNGVSYPLSRCSTAGSTCTAGCSSAGCRNWF